MDLDWGPRYSHLLRTRAYLASLPNGLLSYADCRSKGSVWRNIYQWTDTRSLVDRVPPGIAVLPDADVLGGAWIPAAQSFAGHLVLRDCLFATDEAICEHFRLLDRRLLSGPMYKVMFALASPQMVVHASDRRFAALFQGITLEAQTVEPNRVQLVLKYPPGLLPPLVGRLYLIAFEVAVELAGAKGVTGKVITHGSTAATYDLSWY
jgi:hypothetical protein